MLLRLRVRGFKNLKDVTVRLGPMSCFVGPNGVGKSNLFDAMQFLKLLAESDIQEAASRVRRPMRGSHNPLDLFLGGDPSGKIQLEADMLVPATVADDFARVGRASTTVLRYSVAFRYAADPAPRLELDEESLTHHTKGEARKLLGFPNTRAFQDSVVQGVRRGGPLISTSSGTHREIKLHQDGGSRGQPFPPGKSPKTVLGGTSTYEYPTVLAARREMLSWQFVHLEPSAMRSPDRIGAPPVVTERGAGMAAALAELLKNGEQDVLREVVNELKQLNAEVTDLRVDRDDARDQLVLAVRTRGHDGWLGPRSLSDGTLRYLALVIMRMSPKIGGMLCMEEPENGMHPSRVPALVGLLRDFAVDPELACDADNPLRQVVLNTHSPDIVRQLEPDEVLFVDTLRGQKDVAAIIRPVKGGWRSDMDAVPIHRVVAYIGGSPLSPEWDKRRGQLEFEFGTVE